MNSILNTVLVNVIVERFAVHVKLVTIREQLATVIAEKKNDTVRVDRIEKDMAGVKSDVNDIYTLHQWSLETFHGAKVPKAFHRKN